MPGNPLITFLTCPKTTMVSPCVYVSLLRLTVIDSESCAKTGIMETVIIIIAKMEEITLSYTTALNMNSIFPLLIL